MKSGPTGRQWAVFAAAAVAITAVSFGGELAGLYGPPAWHPEIGLSDLRSDRLGYAVAVVIAVVIMIGYFAPALIAFCRRHPDETPIFLVNVLLGWTVLGWIVALIWATTAVRGEA